MQLAQAAKEKMHTPVFSLAASAAIAATTKSAGTNPIPQPDAGPGRHVFFKTNPISGLARNSCLGHQLPTAILYQGLGLAISNTATRFAHPLYDFRVRPRCTGKERDAETGLDFFEARYFHGPQGRFTTVDLGFEAALRDSRRLANLLSDPQKLNLYSYTRNNPLRYVDPDGHQTLDANVQKMLEALKAPISKAGNVKGGLIQSVGLQLIEYGVDQAMGHLFGFPPNAIKNGLTKPEYHQLQQVSSYNDGNLSVGVGKGNHPGIDAIDLVTGHGISLKTASGDAGKVTKAADQAIEQVVNAGYHNVDVYVFADSITKADVQVSAIQSALSNGAVNKVVVFTKDGTIEVQPSKAQ